MLNRMILIFVLFFLVGVANAQSLNAPPTPTPFIPVGTPAYTIDTTIVPKNDIYNFLATAVANVNSLPDDLGTVAGVSFVPNETASQLMSYAKWLFSANSVREALGNNLAPIGGSLFLWLSLQVVMLVAYLALNIVMIILRVISYLTCLVLKIVPGLG